MTFVVAVVALRAIEAPSPVVTKVFTGHITNPDLADSAVIGIVVLVVTAFATHFLVILRGGHFWGGTKKVGAVASILFFAPR